MATNMRRENVEKYCLLKQMAALSLNSNYRPQFRLTTKTSKKKICAQEVTKLKMRKRVVTDFLQS